MFENCYVDKPWELAENHEPVRVFVVSVHSKVMQKLCKPYSSDFFLLIFTYTVEERMTFSLFKKPIVASCFHV